MRRHRAAAPTVVLTVPLTVLLTVLSTVLLTSCAGFPPAATSGLAPAPPCRAKQVRLDASRTDSVMSQPFVRIRVSARTSASCTLRGYPHVSAPGHRIRLRHGIYEGGDPAPRTVLIASRRSAWFSVGTATAYQGGRHLIRLTHVSVVLPGTGRARTVELDLPATRPPGRAFPVGVTALESAR